MDINLDRSCDACGHAWRGFIECPICGYTPELVPESPSMVTICSWCSGARERTDAALAFGRVVTHTICDACRPKWMAEGRF